MSRFFVTSRIVAAVLVSLVVSGSVLSQTAPVVGIRRTHPNVHVLDGARIVVAPGRVIERGRIVVRGARIAAVGADVVVPDGASVHDVSGLEVWPAFLEPWLGSDPAALKREPPPAEQHVHGHSVQDVPKADPHDHPSGGAHWNARIHPEHVALDDGMPNESRLAELRGAGFAIARLVPSSGILRGRASIITLANAPVANEPGAPVDLGTRIVRAEDVQCAAFERGSGRESYPNSLMGVIALCRQSFYDARWYREAMALHARDGRIARPVLDASLGALGDVAMGKSRIAFEVRSDEDALRVLKLKDEFDLDIELRGSGTEYRHARSFLGVPLIVPLRDIDAPAVSTEAEARAVSLRELLTHRHAPQNAARLAAIGVEFSLSSCLLDGPKDFREQLAKAIRAGLSENDALAATTIRPAALLGLADRTGTIEAGKAANFVVVDGSLLDPGAAIRTTWIEGIEHAVAPVDTDLEGRWQFEIGGFGTYVVEFSKEKPVARDEKESVPGPVLEATFEASLRQEQEGDDLRAIVAARRIASRIELSLRGDKLRDGVGVLRISGTVDGDRIDGHGHELGTELSFAWTAKRLEEDEKSRDDDETAPPSKLELERAIALPEGAYSRSMLPPQKSVLVRNATLWLNDEVVQGNDLLVMDGKIAAIGESLAAPDGALVIDGTSKHVTCGLIDAHSHTAIAGGVNESTLAVTSEVRIEDAIDPTDIGIYRELAGGLTVSHLLHGSANPIGGQSCVIKLRWGADAEGLVMRSAKPTIKFALGENVKQSNWGDDHKTRYPQTRLGVEQILRDRFAMAQEYRAARARGVDDRGLPVRRDLGLDALVEVLEGKRSVHCHSYRQDEIEMLLRVAEDNGFRIGTLQHVLEGYKVADRIAKHGAHASSFSDWWAYKVEVMDAIPYNGAMLHARGVVTSFNSDSDELARRMNTEAAKAIRYGGLAPEVALRFVTKYPAIQLGIDDHVGSLEVGKDGDFVIWSGDPLSTTTRCEQTWIDGRRYFDLEDDARLRSMVEDERARLVSAILLDAANSQSADKDKGAGK